MHVMVHLYKIIKLAIVWYMPPAIIYRYAQCSLISVGFAPICSDVLQCAFLESLVLPRERNYNFEASLSD